MVQEMCLACHGLAVLVSLGTGVTGTIITVADTNWLDQSRFVVGGTTEQQQNVQALDDIIRGVVAGTVFWHNQLKW